MRTNLQKDVRYQWMAGKLNKNTIYSLSLFTSIPLHHFWLIQIMNKIYQFEYFAPKIKYILAQNQNFENFEDFKDIK